MLNKAILMGRLTRDPEMRYTQGGMAVASFTLAVSRSRKAEGQPAADFIDVIAWNKQAEFTCQWFKKGALAVIIGRIQTRNWEDKNGNKRVSVEVVADEIQFGESKKEKESQTVPPEKAGFRELNDNEDVPF